MQSPVYLDGLPTSIQPDVPPGDVIFVLNTKKHASFERSGNDLLTTVHITLSEALLGFSRILITHLDGRGIQVTSPRGKIIKPGDSIVLRDEGMPIHKSTGQKGNLYIMLEIDMPDEEWIAHLDRTVSSPDRPCSSSSSSTYSLQALEGLLPPKKPEMDPRPAVVDEVPFEESDIVDVRAHHFPGSSFFDRSGFAQQFGEGEDGWEDDDDDEDDDDEEDEWGPHGHEPECQPQ